VKKKRGPQPPPGKEEKFPIFFIAGVAVASALMVIWAIYLAAVSFDCQPDWTSWCP
jgi:hypothetical protein